MTSAFILRIRMRQFYESECVNFTNPNASILRIRMRQFYLTLRAFTVSRYNLLRRNLSKLDFTRIRSLEKSTHSDYNFFNVVLLQPYSNCKSLYSNLRKIARSKTEWSVSR